MPLHTILQSSYPISTARTAAARALGVAELRDSILVYLGSSDLASCARACRAWEVPSLRTLWQDAHLNCLFEVLTGGSSEDFVRSEV